MSLKRKNAQSAELERKKLVKNNKDSNDHTIEFIGTGISYLGSGRFEIPVFKKATGKYAQSTEIVCFAEDETRVKCRAFILQTLMQWVYPGLDSYECKILMYVANRTIMFFKTLETIPTKHFINGIEGVDAGSGIKHKNHLWAPIAKLQEKGLLLVNKKANSRPSEYMLNFNGINKWVQENFGGIMRSNVVDFGYSNEHYDFDFGPSEEIAQGGTKSVPKGVQKRQQSGTKSVPHNSTIYNRTNKTKLKEASSHDSASASAFIEEFKENGISSHGDDLISFRAKTGQVAQKAEQERKDRILAKPTTVTAAKALQFFDVLAKEKYPARLSVAPTGKVTGMLRHMIKATEFPEGDFLDFLRFVVAKWDTIRIQHFEFINRGRSEKGKNELSYPEFPELGFVCQFKSNFLSAYQKECNHKLSASDLYAERLRAKGMGEVQVAELVTKKIENDCNYDKSRQDYFKGLENIQEERERIELERKNVQREVQLARNAVYLLKTEADKEEKRMASLRVTQLPQKTISTIDNVEPVTDWNGLSNGVMQSIAKAWIEQYIPGFAFYTEAFFQEIFMKEFNLKKGDLSFVYSSMITNEGSYYDRRKDLKNYDEEYAILKSRGDEAGIKDLQDFYAEELTPGFRRFESE